MEQNEKYCIHYLAKKKCCLDLNKYIHNILRLKHWLMCFCRVLCLVTIILTLTDEFYFSFLFLNQPIIRRCTHVLIPRWQCQDSSGSNCEKLSKAIESLWDVSESTLHCLSKKSFTFESTILPHLFKQSILMRGVKNRTENGLYYLICENDSSYSLNYSLSLMKLGMVILEYGHGYISQQNFFFFIKSYTHCII